MIEVVPADVFPDVSCMLGGNVILGFWGREPSSVEAISQHILLVKDA